MIKQAELQTLQSKINPHFLYNSLNSIASLIHEDADKAEDMTLKLSRLFRSSINSAQENMAQVTEEMEIVNTYLEIEKVRFGDRLSFYIDAEDKYVFLHTADGKKHLTDFTIGSLEEKLPQQFVRIHRGSIINGDHIKEIRKSFNGAFVFVMNNNENTRLTSSRSNGRC